MSRSGRSDDFRERCHGPSDGAARGDWAEAGEVSRAPRLALHCSAEMNCPPLWQPAEDRDNAALTFVYFYFFFFLGFVLFLVLIVLLLSLGPPYNLNEYI